MVSEVGEFIHCIRTERKVFILKSWLNSTGIGFEAFILVRYESGQFGGMTAFGLPRSQYTLNIFDMSSTRHEQFVTITPSSLTL